MQKGWFWNFCESLPEPAWTGPSFGPERAVQFDCVWSTYLPTYHGSIWTIGKYQQHSLFDILVSLAAPEPALLTMTRLLLLGSGNLSGTTWIQKGRLTFVWQLVANRYIHTYIGQVGSFTEAFPSGKETMATSKCSPYFKKQATLVAGIVLPAWNKNAHIHLYISLVFSFSPALAAFKKIGWT
jgi:hypothetical protein